MFGLFKKTKKKPSSGLFIYNGDKFVEASQELSVKSINQIIQYLDYNLDQVHTILTFDIKDITTIGVKAFTKEPVFIQTEPSVDSISKSRLNNILRSIDWEFEYRSFTIEEILASAIENHSFTAGFLSEIFNIEIEPDSIITINKIGYKLVFNENILVDFNSSDGLNHYSKNIKNTNEELFNNILSEANIYHKDISDAIHEVNEQSKAWANTPHGYGNEYIELHRSGIGNINFFNLLLTHYDHKCTLNEFMLINKGRYIKLDQYQYQVSNYRYIFSNDLFDSAIYNPT